MMNTDAASGQIHDYLLAFIHLAATVEQDIGGLGLRMPNGAQMRTRDKLHRAIVLIYIVQRQPDADQVGWCTFPIGVVLMPENGTAVIGWLIECLIME
jgi:hypothetical protein